MSEEVRWKSEEGEAAVERGGQQREDEHTLRRLVLCASAAVSRSSDVARGQDKGCSLAPTRLKEEPPSNEIAYTSAKARNINTI